jgi:hypothetical protein
VEHSQAAAAAARLNQQDDKEEKVIDLDGAERAKVTPDGPA